MTTDTPRATSEAGPQYRTRLELPSDTETLLTREFRAPRPLVWAALTTPEHVRQWYGCGMAELTTCEIDLRPGGQWHYVLTSPDGHEDSFSGEYHEVDPPARLVATERYDNVPGAEYRTTVTLEEVDGVTTFRNLLQYAAKEMRDGHIASGMEHGMNASMDALERLVLSLA